MGVQDNVHACGCNEREVRRGGLRKEDLNGGSDMGALGRNQGRALGRGTLLTRQVEVGYGCNGEIHTVEAGMGRGCLLDIEHHIEILRVDVWVAPSRKAQVAVEDTSVEHLWIQLATAWAWVSALPSQVVTQER